MRGVEETAPDGCVPIGRWPYVPLGELAAGVRNACVGGPFGSELTTKDYVDGPGVPVIRGVNLGESGFIDDGFVYVSERKAEALQQNQARRGDIAFTQRGTIGQIALIPPDSRYERYIISQSQMKLTPDLSRVEPRFLIHYFRSPSVLQFLKSSTLATGVPHINLTILRRVPVPLLPLPEQRRIADILDKADAIRRKRKEAIALTEELLRSAFLDMFGDPVTNPKGWEVRMLGALAEAASGVTKGKHYDGQVMVTLPYMRVANVQDGHLVLDEVKTITVSREDGRRFQLQNGDVLLTEGGDPDKLGRGAVWRGEIPECIHQNHIFRVRPGQDVRPEYLSAIVGSERGKQYFLRAAKQTTGIATINMSQLKAFPVLLPPLPVQDQYVKYIRRAEAARDALHKRHELAGTLFESLVARAFSGELSGVERAC
jgi:type I restriction enzyme S subunit